MSALAGLNQATKIAADPHTSTLLFPGGHQVRVAHAALSPIHRKMIEKMPVKMAEGGDTPPADPVGPAPSAKQQGSDAGPDEFDQAMQSLKTAVPRAFEGDPAQQQSDYDASLKSLPQTPGAGASGDWTPPPGYLPPASDTLPDQGAPVAAPAAPSDASDEPDEPTAPPQTPIPNVGVGDVYNSGTTAITQQQKASSDLAQKRVEVDAQQAQEVDKEQNRWKIEQAEKLGQIDKATEDVRTGMIQPNHYLENQSVPKKIATAIGMILGGGSTGGQGPNPGMQFLQSQIGRDIDAQQKNQDTRKTLLGAYQQQYKDNGAAHLMTQATLHSIYADKIQQAADANGTLQAKAAAANNAFNLKKEIAPMVMQANLLHQGSQFQGGASGGEGQNAGQANSSHSGQGGVLRGSESAYQAYLNAAQAINPERYKDAQSKYYPGLGVASQAIAAPDKERLMNMNALAPMIDKAISDQTSYGKLGAWSPKNHADADSDTNALQVSLNKLTGLNRLNDHEYVNYGNQIGKLGGMNMGGTLETLKNLKGQLDSDRNSFMKAAGIKPFPESPIQYSAPGNSAPRFQHKVGDVVNYQGHNIQFTDTKGSWKKVK
jgi:hypothetical protein